MTSGKGGATFAFTKLVVHDLDRAAAFYRAACGYTEDDLLQADLDGRPVEEIVLRTPEGALDLVVLRYPRSPPPSRSDVITGLYTPDLDAFQERVLGAGGTVVHAIKSIEVGAHRMRIGFFADPEGNLLEVMER